MNRRNWCTRFCWKCWPARGRKPVLADRQIPSLNMTHCVFTVMMREGPPSTASDAGFTQILDGLLPPLGTKVARHAANSRHGWRRPAGAKIMRQMAAFRHGRRRPIGAKIGRHAANSRHGRRRPTIHVFSETSTVRRGWCAYAHHDGDRTTPYFSPYGRRPTIHAFNEINIVRRGWCAFAHHDVERQMSYFGAYGRRPTVHDFNKTSTVRRRLSAFADHDGGMTTPYSSVIGSSPATSGISHLPRNRNASMPSPVMTGLNDDNQNQTLILPPTQRETIHD